MNRISPDPLLSAFRPMPDTACFYASEGHARALTMLEFAVEANQAIAVLTGDVGTGKTLLLRLLMQRYGDQIDFGLLGQDGAELFEPLRWVLRAFDQDHSDAAPIDLLNRLHRFIAEGQEKGRRVMLIADEAQSLSVEELDQLRQLTDLHADGRATMPLLLVGQPGLRARIDHRDSLALRSRIGGRCDLPPLTPSETPLYVAHRLAQARSHGVVDGPVFDADSLALLHEATGGLPRAINHLAQRCLFAAARSGRTRIDADFLRHGMDTDWDETRPDLRPEPAAKPVPQSIPAPEMLTASEPEPLPAPELAPEPLPAHPDETPKPLVDTHPAELPAPPPRPVSRQALPVPVPVSTGSRKRGRIVVGLSALAGLAAIAVGVTMLMPRPSTPPAALNAPPPAPAPPTPALAPVEASVPPLARVTAISPPPDPKQLLIAALGAEAIDTAQAAMLYERAALWGSARAAYYLGQYYEAGLGVPVDPLRAKAWYGMADGISGAEARLRALEAMPQSRGEMQTPVPVMQALFPDGRTEIHWRKGAGSSPAGFAVEYQLAGSEDGALQRAETPLSALLVDGPVARWRLVAVDADGHAGQPGAWIDAAPPAR